VHLDPAAAKALTASMRAPRRTAVAALTPRERDVIVLIARAGQTGRSASTWGDGADRTYACIGSLLESSQARLSPSALTCR
jgi:hypothetical protein